MNFELFVALRYLKARRKGVFTLLTTIIAVGGITLGVASLIITLSVMSGFHRDIKEKILGVQPHIIVLKDGLSPFTEYRDVAKKISDNEEVTTVSPFVYGQAIIRNKISTTGALVKGIDPALEEKLVNLKKTLVAGALPREIGEILLGVELAKNIGANQGQDIILMSPGTFAGIPRMEKFKVCGLFHSGMYDYDANLTFVSLESGRKLFSMDDSVSGIGVSIKDWDNAAATEAKLQGQLGGMYWARSWQQMNRNLFAALKLEKIMMFIILTLIILVAAFNIISNLLLLTVEKTKEIGILSALGVKSAAIGRIFFYEGLVLGGSGIAFGSILGIGLSLMLKKYKFIHLPADVYYIDTLPIRIIPSDIASVIAAAMVITLISCVYPAYQASKLDPLEAIRYG